MGNPTLCIVKGAAYFAITNNYITARRLKFSYGVLMCFSINQAKQIGISDEYIKKHKHNGGIQNCFNVILRKNDRIETNGEPKTIEAEQMGKISTFHILRSDKIFPKTSV